MSVKFISWAFEQDIPTNSRFVLVVMADCADHEGYCWPSRKDISKKTGISERSVTRAIKDLTERGIIKVQERRRDDGYRTSNGYVLQKISGDTVSGDRLSGDNECNSQGTQCLGNITTNVVIEPSLEPSKARARFPDWLDLSVWEDYQRHRKQLGKPLTATAADRALKKLDRLRTSGQDPTAIIEQSLENGWTGLFELKERKHGKSKLKTEAEQLLDDIRAGRLN